MKKSLLLLVIIGSIALLPEYSYLQDNQNNSGSIPVDALSQTICRTGLSKSITDFNLTRDTINFTIPVTCTLLDVNVRIDTVIHTFISDLVVRLTKGNSTVMMINQRGAGGSNFIGTRLNDSAAIPVASGNAPFTGEFRPESPLSAFNGIPPGGIWMLSIRDTAADDTGVLKAWCITISYDCGDPVNNINTEIPSKFSLSQNYPNPFNPATKIAFGIPPTSASVTSAVKLVIYDALGREVEVLVNEKLMAGNYEVSWNAKENPSGVYYYKLVSGEFSEVRKMVLVK